MRTFFLLAALAVVLPAHSQPAVEAPDLVLPDEAANAAVPAKARAEGKTRGRIDRKVMRDLAPGRHFGFTPPGAAQRQFVVERTVDHANGDRTVVGRLIGGEGEHRAIVTTGAGGTVGRMDAPEGRFLLHGSGDALEVTDRKASGRRVAPVTRDDDRRPPRSARLQAESEAGSGGSSAPASPPAAYAIPAGNSVIDLLVLTSPKMATRYPGALLQTRINNLIEIANQAYINSRIAITLRVVRQQQVAYGDAQNLDQVLDDLTNGSGALAAVPALRTQYGADLVTLLRPYDGAVDSGCGVAWVIDHADSPANFNRTLGMSVVSDGDDLRPGSPYYCADTALAHEIGHNLGSAHDRAHSSAAGTYSYSYGHGFDNVFGTIMSYIDPGVELFSNPRINACAGRPCGVAIGSPGEADNATSMNNTRAATAGFTAAVLPVSSGSNDLIVDFGGLWLRRNDSTWEPAKGLSAQQMATGDLDKDGLSDVLIDFGSPHGIWLWHNGSSWSRVHSATSTQIVATDLDNNGVTDFAINFGSAKGLWVRRNETTPPTWSLLNALSPRQVVSASLDADPRRDLVVDFGAPYGIYLYMNDTGWVPFFGAAAEDIVAGDLDGNGIDDIVLDLGPQNGLWVRMNQNSWVALHGLSPQRMIVGNIDSDARKDLVVDFGGGHGIWVWKNHAAWAPVYGAASKTLAMADLDRNGTDDLVVDFGPASGLWAWKNGANWVQLHGASPRQFIALDVDGQ